MCIFCGGSCGGIGDALVYPLVGSGLAYSVIKIQAGSFLRWRREKPCEKPDESEYEEPLALSGFEADN